MKKTITTCDICGKKIATDEEISIPVKYTVNGSLSDIGIEKLNLCYDCIIESTNVCREYNKEEYYLKMNSLIRREVNIIEHSKIIK